MDTIKNNVAVKSVVFTSNDADVLLKGTIEKGHLSYDTEMVITQTQLNLVLNSLKRQNDVFSIDDCLSSERIDRDETLYYADFDHLANSLINIEALIGTQEILQIRA
ncbi:MAG: hypothetical protein ACI865_001389 [Flavobacteriaceae bacterium]|jgi:hypothetical protein